MANEELVQRGYIASGKLKGTPFGEFEELNIGATTLKELVSVGVSATLPDSVDFPFKEFAKPKAVSSAKPDRIFLARTGNQLRAVAVGEHKAPGKLRKKKEIQRAAEQGLFNAYALGAPIAITTNGKTYLYVDVHASMQNGEIVYFNEKRDLNPAVISNLLKGDAGVVKDPKPLAETVWQIIWHATKEEPKQCLLTFVEIFVLKFLSDNLPKTTLPEAYSFYALLDDPQAFEERHGVSAIEYYVTHIRPHIKKLFPDNVVVGDSELPKLFGLSTLVSKTSIINGFAFLKSSHESLLSFNRAFLDILHRFHEFGPLTTIDPEFKLRLYETFLRRSARQQKLGQFFTPRNVVQQMIRMARLDKLPDGAIVLDPAAGVGGFVLEPMLLPDALGNNLQFSKGRPVRRVKTVGVDVDVNMHILAKANMLIHLAEIVRDPSTTIDSLNRAMAETFVLMNTNETLGALEYPPRDNIDVVLTNPPYVTRGSGVYKDELAHVKGLRNGVDLRDYYEGSGLGLEALFLRYISGALKAGGRAFVVVPHGMLNRTEAGPKQRILDECNVIASIQLPRNTFFNTSQKTYIFVLEKRHTKVDVRPEVFCAIARSTGETLDYKRIPTPHDNDLAEIAEAFVAFCDGDRSAAEASPVVKIAAASDFSDEDRWDVPRFWSDEELVGLGERESAIDQSEFIGDVSQQLSEINAEMAASLAEITALTSGPMREVGLDDEAVFLVRSGDRIRDIDIHEHPGELPVYSCFKDDKQVKGHVDEAWVVANKKTVETKPFVTVNANGASVGKVFVRNERCAVTDDVIIVEVKRDDIDMEYLATQLRRAIAEGNFIYEAKLFAGRVRELAVSIPVDAKGEYDLEQERRIASAMKRFETTRQRLRELGEWAGAVRIS